MTSLYTFRLIFIAFHGEAKTEAHAGHGIAHWLPLSVLIVLSTAIGAMIVPPLHGVLPQEASGMPVAKPSTAWKSPRAPSPLSGILLAALLFLGKRRFVTAIASNGIGRLLGLVVRRPGASTGSTTSCSSSPLPGDQSPAAQRPVRPNHRFDPRLAKGSQLLSRTPRRVNCVGTPPRWLLVPCWLSAPSW